MDSRRIERILRNLVVQRHRARRGQARSRSRSAANDTAVAVTVRDHGVGLRPGEAALVFTRFWRADPARARTTGGTGLGLAIALEDARLHAGRLEAWGARGEGSCFRLTLPRQADATITSSPLPLSPLAAEAARAPRRRRRRGPDGGTGPAAGPPGRRRHGAPASHRRGARAVRGRRFAALLLVASTVLAACGGLPGTGPVVEGRALGEALNEPVRVVAVGPVDGASQEAIVRGFLRAGEDIDETHATGTLFLAPQSVDLWRWSSEDVVVYDGDLTVKQLAA